MKKKVTALVLAFALTVPLFCVGSFAAGGSLETGYATGFYFTSATTAENVTITPQDDNGAEISGKKVNWSTAASLEAAQTLTYTDTYYPASTRLSVTYSGAAITAGSQVAVFLVEGNGLTEGSTICYINQDAKSSGSLTFDVYGILPTATTEMTLYITSSSADTIAIPLGYAANEAYTAQPYILGDVDNDGTVDVSDAVCILKKLVGQYELTGTKELAADVDKSGTVDVSDAVCILKKLVGQYTIGG